MYYYRRRGLGLIGIGVNNVAAESQTKVPAGLTAGKIEELKELASLKQSGVLSITEFDREKQRILGNNK